MMERPARVGRGIPAVLAILCLSASAPRPPIGSVVSPTSAEALDGAVFALPDALRGRSATAFVFLSTICPYSNAFNDRLRDLAASFEARGASLVGVYPNRTESAEEIGAHARRFSHSFLLLRDPQGRLALALGASRTPEAVVVDQAGRIRYRGRIESKLGVPDLARALESVLAAREVRPAETKAFGCSIDGFRDTEAPR